MWSTCYCKNSCNGTSSDDDEDEKEKLHNKRILKILLEVTSNLPSYENKYLKSLVCRERKKKLENKIHNNTVKKFPFRRCQKQ